MIGPDGAAISAGLAIGGAVLMVLVALRRTVVVGRVRSRMALADGAVGGTATRWLPGSDPQRWTRSLLAVAVAVPAAALLGWPRSVALGGFGVVAWWARGVQRRRHTARALTRELPEALDAVVGVLRSGGSLLEGLRAASTQPFEPSVRRDLALVLAEIDRGGTVGGALTGWAARRNDRDLRTVATLAAAATTTGGPLATALARISATIRQRQAQAREVEALVSQARLSAMVLVVLPVGVLPLMDLLGAVTIPEVLADPVSRIAVLCGIVMDLLGLVWMRFLVARLQA
ncbi:MAG: type II secretion system F family protein [Acidimicrobiales bacterium]